MFSLHDFVWRGPAFPKAHWTLGHHADATFGVQCSIAGNPTTSLRLDLAICSTSQTLLSTQMYRGKVTIPQVSHNNPEQSSLPAVLTSTSCRQIPRLSSQHREHHDGNGQHGLCDQGVSSSCGGALGHDQAGHLWSHSATCPLGQLPGSF